MFRELRHLLDLIWSGESRLTLKEFEQRVQDAYAAGKLSGTEYDWLMGNIY